MKLVIVILLFTAQPAPAQNANGASGAATYGPTSGGSGNPVGSTSVSPVHTEPSPTPTPEKKTNGASITFGPEDDSADGGHLKTKLPKTSMDINAADTKGTNLEAKQNRRPRPLRQ